MKNQKNKLIIAGLLPADIVKFEQDQRVYDSNGIARTIKCNGGGNYLIYEEITT